MARAVASIEKKIYLDKDKFQYYNETYIQNALERGGKDIVQTASKLCPVDQGHLRAGIRFVMEDFNVLRVGTVQREDAEAVEYGTLPHAPPYDPNTDSSPIKEWAKRKGIRNWKAVYFSIMEKGTKPHPFMRPAIHKHMPDVHEYLRQAMVKAAIKGGAKRS